MSEVQRSLLGELRRRNVFRVRAMYAVVARRLLQIGDGVGEPLHLSDWFQTDQS